MIDTQFKNNGFTLVELMIVVAIIGVLSAIALPAYQDYIIRSRITEGLNLASSAKTMVVMDGAASLQGLKLAADTWNAQNGGVGATSKFVYHVCITNIPPAGGPSNCGAAVPLGVPNSGVISINYNEVTVGLPAGANQIQLHPYVRSGAIVIPTLVGDLAGGNNSGSIDWACISATSAIANTRLDPTLAGLASGVPARFAPAECR